MSRAQPLAAERERLMKSPAFLNKRHEDHAVTMARHKAVTEAMYGRRRGVRLVRLT